METDSVKLFNWGFQQGLNYTNEHYGTKIVMEDKNVIFCAAGAVGSGVIKEARERVQSGSEVWVVGVDVDQYDDGLYADGQSVILTSAMKKVNVATQDVIEAAAEGNFPGGQTLTYNIMNDGVGIPELNPNLSDETMQAVHDIYEKVKAGEIVVANNGEGLIP